MGERHMPFGYRIENGAAVVYEEEAAQIRRMYEGYLGGLSLVAVAAREGLALKHTSVKYMLQNPRLLGNEFYPAIIDRETFEAFEDERRSREKAMGRDKLPKRSTQPRSAPTSFWMRQPAPVNYDPYKQAEYMYSLIEREV